MTPFDILQARYPELAFLLTCLSGGEEVFDEVSSCPDLSKVEVVYQLGLAEPPQEVQEWLRANPDHRLIVLEDRLPVLSTFLRAPRAISFFEDRQIHLYWLHLEGSLDECVARFPALSIEVISTTKKAALLKKVRLLLMRKSAVVDAQIKEVLYSHRLVENVIPNIQRWPYSFLANRLSHQFKQIPAIICGAGPSLNQHIPYLKELEDRALILAGGSAITALSNQGVVPHLGLALDPNPEEYDRLRLTSAFEMPLLYGTRVRKEIFCTSNGPWGYIQSCTGGSCERYFEEWGQLPLDPIGPDLGEEAFSVTTLAIALAVSMGCNPIILSGVDLAYTGMQRYASGVMPSSAVQATQLKTDKRAPDRLLRRKNIHGQMVYTQVRWVMEASAIARYAQARPHIAWFNASPHSLPFPGIPSRSLEEIPWGTPLDLRGKIHQQIQTLGRLPIQPAGIASEFTRLHESLNRLLDTSHRLVQEINHLQDKPFDQQAPFPTSLMTLLQMDFEEETAFQCFFAEAGPILDRYVNQRYPQVAQPMPQEERAATLKRLRAKWEYIHLQTRALSEIVPIH